MKKMLIVVKATQEKKEKRTLSLLDITCLSSSRPSRLLVLVFPHDCPGQRVHSTHRLSRIAIENVRTRVISRRQWAFFENTSS